MLILGVISTGILIYGICKTVKGETKEVWQMIDEEYKEEKKLKEEWTEVKDKYFKWIDS